VKNLALIVSFCVLTGCLEAQLEKKEEIDSTSDSIEENSGENDSG